MSNWLIGSKTLPCLSDTLSGVLSTEFPPSFCSPSGLSFSFWEAGLLLHKHRQNLLEMSGRNLYEAIFTAGFLGGPPVTLPLCHTRWDLEIIVMMEFGIMSIYFHKEVIDGREIVPSICDEIRFKKFFGTIMTKNPNSLLFSISFPNTFLPHQMALTCF